MDKVAFVILVFCFLHANAKQIGPFTIQVQTDNNLYEENEIDSIFLSGSIADKTLALSENEDSDSPTTLQPDTLNVLYQRFADKMRIEPTLTLSENEDSDSIPTTLQPDISDDDVPTQETLAEIDRITKRNYIKWVAGLNGNFSDDAVMVTRGDGSKVIICRANHNGGVIPGKLIPGESGCRFGTDRIEHQTQTYEVLTDPKNATFWIPFTPDAMKYAVQGGHREYRPTATLHVVRAKIHGILTPGKQWIEDGTCSVPFNGGEYFIYPFEILVYA